MWTTAQIRRHVTNLQPGELFTTRNLLLYGTRGAVDQAIYVLVESSEIERLARGVFMKPGLAKRVVTAFEIAQVKAAAFGKYIVSHATDAAKKLGLLEKGNEAPIYMVNGSSSSFRFGNTVIYLKRASARKMILGDDKVGLAIKAIWQMGKHALTDALIQSATREFGRPDRNKFHYVKDLMPGWLSDYLHDLYCKKGVGPRRGKRYWSVFWGGRKVYARSSAGVNPI